MLGFSATKRTCMNPGFMLLSFPIPTQVLHVGCGAVWQQIQLHHSASIRTLPYHTLSALYCTFCLHRSDTVFIYIVDLPAGVHVCCCCTTGSFMVVFAHPGSCFGIPPVWPDSYGRPSQGECVPALPGAAAGVCVCDLLCCDLVHHCQVRKLLNARWHM